MSTLAEQVAALQPGDGGEFDFTYDGHPATVTGECWTLYGILYVGLAVVRGRDGSPHPSLTAVRVITPAEPPCPFEIGDRVRAKDHHDWTYTVTGWSQSHITPNDRWEVECDDDNGQPCRKYPENLELVPDVPACPFEIGATVYLIDGRGEPLTVADWNGELVRIDWPNAALWYSPERLSLTMPEPPIGSIVVDRKDVALQHCDANYWWAGGFPNAVKWPELLTFGPLTVLRWGGAK